MAAEGHAELHVMRQLLEDSQRASAWGGGLGFDKASIA